MMRPSAPPHPAGRLALYARLIRLDKPVGIFLLLWPALWALFIAAGGMPGMTVLGVFILGVVLMRSAGCAINDFADRDIDPLVARTRNRPVASGALAPGEAVVLAAVLAGMAFVLAVLLLNRLTIGFAVGGALLAATYPFTKRLHCLPQVHLGVAFAWSVPMAFTATTGSYPPPVAWLLFACTVLWTVAYDTMYAMADREDDLKVGVKSTAILFGRTDRLAVGLMQALVIAALARIGFYAGLGAAYYTAVCVGAGLFLYQQGLIRDRYTRRCLQAFLNNQYFGLVIFIGILVHYWMHPA